jgi:hypothetical protein
LEDEHVECALKQLDPALVAIAPDHDVGTLHLREVECLHANGHPAKRGDMKQSLWSVPWPFGQKGFSDQFFSISLHSLSRD